MPLPPASESGSAIDCNGLFVDPPEPTEFVRLIIAQERLIYAYILSLVPDWPAADDILQETYARLLERMNDWDPTKNLYGWACAIARYQVLTYRKRNRRDPLQFNSDFIEHVAERYPAKSDAFERRMEALSGCIQELTESNRQLLEMAYRTGTNIEQVAEQTQRSVPTTQRALSRVRSALRHCIERTLRSLP